MSLHEQTKDITKLILKAKEKAYKETSNQPEPELTHKINWPVDCSVKPGLEGAIACETKIGYVNGTKGWLIYQGYDIFDLCAHCSFEEVTYLLLHGKLPTETQLANLKEKLKKYGHMPNTVRRLMNFAVEDMHPMMALRLGTNLMRQKEISNSSFCKDVELSCMLSDDEMCSNNLDNCYHLIAGLATLTGSITRLKICHLPIEADPELSHAGNLLYMMTGQKPTSLQERIMDVCLILHADHGLNASTFAALVVASTLSDIYFAIGSGIAALYGPLHGGANEKVVNMLKDIKTVENIQPWLEKKLSNKEKIMGFGHRVYKAYDPRARILSPLAQLLTKDDKTNNQFKIASTLEKIMIEKFKEKKTFPNVDFYSGIVYQSLGIPSQLYTPIFATSRVAGWTARVIEYLQQNRIFRPQGIYIGNLDKQVKPIKDR